MLEKDAEGHYIAADKLIEIAQYYGFDGYIFNAESGTGVSGFKVFWPISREISRITLQLPGITDLAVSAPEASSPGCRTAIPESPTSGGLI